MTSVRSFLTIASVMLLGFAGDPRAEDVQSSEDPDSLPIEADSSNIEIQEERLEKSRPPGEPEERIRTPDTFEPSEAISEDIAVPFPVDI